ncbi:DUF2939 domain-containing protein [Hymenobacter lutimineralis]|uniref:DUF2939 domain-containing protein n=1 Tax=Hymenobacter lutimineralis TaxID=2606448 RepID=A0A5D6V7D8_9BACT|nr:MULTISPECIES: DUF2939 domain-containing protein [Hymenobacter]QIX61535.1 DUF2939 domain-containing protein [Hymenobacter sp. BT18]TYZ11456.1 DUF2939 domain-containing protein [Hymenobacter lutimineralis]
MKKIVIALVLAGVLIGGYLYYRHVVGSPEYSLMQAAKAAQSHDATTFARYVDVESVTGSLVDQITTQGSVLGVLNPGGLAMKGALGLIKPQLTKAARREVEQYIATGSLEAAAPKHAVNVSILGLAGKVVSPDSKFKGLKYSREEGEQAFLGLEFTQPRYDTTVVVEVKMRNQGDYWQATEITNTGEILKHVARMEKSKLLSR